MTGTPAVPGVDIPFAAVEEMVRAPARVPACESARAAALLMNHGQPSTAAPRNRVRAGVPANRKQASPLAQDGVAGRSGSSAATQQRSNAAIAA
jgi:hypothetical protein